MLMQGAPVNGFLYLLYLALTIYGWLIVARALLSWLQLRPGSTLFTIYRVLIDVTEPYVGLFRRLLPMARYGTVGLDLSPMVALIVLFIAAQLVARL
jgi:YggT family protein